MQLKADAEADDADEVVKLEYFTQRLDLKHFDSETATAELAKLSDLTAEQQFEFLVKRLDLGHFDGASSAAEVEKIEGLSVAQLVGLLHKRLDLGHVDAESSAAEVEKIEGLSVDQHVGLLIKRLNLGHLNGESVVAESKNIEGLTAAHLTRITEAIIPAEITVILSKVTRGDVDSSRAAGEKFKVMADEGRTPSDTLNTRKAGTIFNNFWVLQMTWAEHAKDAAVYERAYDAMFEQHGDNPRTAGFFRPRKEVLDGLKAEAESENGDSEEGETDDDDGMGG